MNIEKLEGMLRGWIKENEIIKCFIPTEKDKKGLLSDIDKYIKEANFTKVNL